LSYQEILLPIVPQTGLRISLQILFRKM